MPPHLTEHSVSARPQIQAKKTEVDSYRQFETEIVWKNVSIFFILHLLFAYSFWILCTEAKWLTRLTIFPYIHFVGLGITAGVHRLWAHRTYEAKLPLRILLMILQTCSVQNDIHEWTRDHRVHHKFTETDADPHNSKRGFFFAHMGWLMMKKHRDVIVKGATVDMSDVEADPVVKFQKKYYLPLVAATFFIHGLVPRYLWGETWWNSVVVFDIFRVMLTLHYTWLLNSAGHMFGNQPYDKSVLARENRLVAYLTNGEGWHNYHHVFPWDYKTAELGDYRMNCTTAFLDLMAWIGWAYNLKMVSANMIKKRVEKTGDGSWVEKNKKRKILNNDYSNDNRIWGWGDNDMKEEDVDNIKS